MGPGATDANPADDSAAAAPPEHPPVPPLLRSLDDADPELVGNLQLLSARYGPVLVAQAAVLLAGGFTMADDGSSSSPPSAPPGAIELGAVYADVATGLRGTAIGLWLKMAATPQVHLARIAPDGKIAETWLDAGRLARVPASPAEQDDERGGPFL